MKTRRIFVSLPADYWLTSQENKTKWAIVEAIEKLGYKTEIFLDPRGKRSFAASKAWSAERCDSVMRRCDGCAILGFRRWPAPGSKNSLPTEYSHYEGAVAHTLDLPMLVLVQRGLLRRVVFDPNFEGYVGHMPAKPTPQWLNTPDFQIPLDHFRHDLECRRDVFLGYCGASSKLAAKVKDFLTTKLKVTVLDWQTDFQPGTMILDQIKEAAERCGAGIFLFTKDDELAGKRQADRSVPRDNVVFEAGYFASIKGKSRALIVREAGAKLPADLGGDIYAALRNKQNIDPIKPILERFVRAL